MDAYNLNSQPEILYRTNPDYKNCVVGIDLWYPEKTLVMCLYMIVT